MITLARYREGVTSITIEGSITFGCSTAAALVWSLYTLLLGEDCGNIIFNLSNVPYMDAGGLALLVGCWATVKKNGGQAKLVGAVNKLRSLLVITKLITTFDGNYKTEQDAITSFFEAYKDDEAA